VLMVIHKTSILTFILLAILLTSEAVYIITMKTVFIFSFSSAMTLVTVHVILDLVVNVVKQVS